MSKKTQQQVVISGKQYAPVQNQRQAAKKKKQNYNPSMGKMQIVTLPRAISTVPKKANNPRIRSTRTGFVVTNRELIKTLVSKVGALDSALNSRLRINPGSESAFPWLSGIAQNFEFYKFHRLAYEFVTRLGTNTSGSLLFAIDYDAADASPITETQVATMQGAIEIAIWQPMKIHAKPESLNRLYKSHPCMADVRFSSTAQDEKTVDAGQFLIWEVIETENAQEGKLWVEYEVEFFIPQPRTESPSNMGGDQLVKTVGLTVNSATPFSTNSIQGSLGQAVPIIGYSGGAFPSRDLLKFVEDFEGVLTTQVTGTTLTNVAGPLINGVAATAIGGAVINAGANTGTRTDRIIAKAGDLLGFSQQTGAAWSSIVADIASRGGVDNILFLPTL